MKDERERGIQYLKIVSEKGRYSKDEAKFALIEIYYFEDRYEEALLECEAIREKYSCDPTWLYLTAKINDKLSQWESAKQHFITLLAILENAPYKSNGYLAECHNGIAKCAFELNDVLTARAELDVAFQFSELWDKKKEIEGPLLDFEKVLDQIKKLDKELTKLQNSK